MRSSPTIVIDNGTYECRAGYPGKLVIKFPNRFYKAKDMISFEAPSHGTSEKFMYDENVITNFENAEIVFDHIFESMNVKSTENLVITEKPHTPKFSRKKLLSMFFELYNFKKVQFGFDAVYAMIKNEVKTPALCISLSNSAITAIDIKNRIENIDIIYYGAKQCKNYVQTLLNNKYTYTKITKEIVDDIVENLNICLEYDEECDNILKKLKDDVFVDDYEPSFLKVQPKKPVDNSKLNETRRNNLHAARMKKLEEEKMDRKNVEVVVDNDENDNSVENADKIENGQEEIITSEKSEEKKVELTAEEELAKKRRAKIAYFSAVHRMKMRIAKIHEKLAKRIGELIEKYEIETNLPDFILSLKSKINEHKSNIQKRGNVLRELKNKRSIYSEVKNKDPSLGYTDEEYELLELIKWAKNDTINEETLAEMEKLINKVKTFEPLYEAYEFTTYQVLYGLAIERRKFAEIIFQPSIINMQCAGLTEIFERRTSKNIFVSGGFSKIKNLKERIEFEAQPFCEASNKVNITFAQDPIYDSFYGMDFSGFFPIFYSDEFNEVGVERIINKFEF